MIRSVLPGDAPRIAEIYNHYIEHTAITFEEQVTSFDEVTRRIAEITQRLPWFVYAENGTVIGYCYASPWKSRSAYRFSVESSIYVANSFGGRGVGTLLYEHLLNDLKARGVHAVMGGITLPNEVSVRLHEKLGFRKVAQFQEVGFKFGRWVDIGYWERLL